jgi:hypothetical protein
LNDYLRPLLHRVLDNLADTVAYGLLPPAARSDPVMWVRREHNSVADHLCNKTMDTLKCDWRKDRGIQRHPGSDVVIFFDGGTRQTCSASAWVLSVLYDGKLVPAVAGGLYFAQPISSFTAEAIALEHATDELQKWLS